MLNVADSERTVHGSAPGGVALHLVSALPSDPMTIDHLEPALGRYLEVDRRTPGSGSFQPGVVCFDLTSRPLPGTTIVGILNCIVGSLC
jgi:hypothetical protein